MKFKRFLETQELNESRRREAGRVARQSRVNIFKEVGLDERRFEYVLMTAFEDVAEVIDNPILNLSFNPPNEIKFELTSEDHPEDYHEPRARQIHITKKQVEKALKETAKDLRVNLKLEKFKKGRARRTSRSEVVVSISK